MFDSILLSKFVNKIILKRNYLNYDEYKNEELLFNNFIAFILQFKTRKDFYCFKICGTSAIGKSMTLFLI